VRSALMRALEEKRQALEDAIANNIEGFEIRSKEGHPLWRFLSKVMFWNPRISSGFITTLYPVVWVPSLPWKSHSPATAIEVLAHEYVHLQDRKRLGLLFNLLYLAPQIFSLFTLLGFINPWFFTCILFLAPWPSPGRAWLEYRGYRMSMAVTYWVHGCGLDSRWIVSQFTGPNYYWMYPFHKVLERHLKEDYKKIRRNYLTSELKEVKSILGL